MYFIIFLIFAISFTNVKLEDRTNETTTTTKVDNEEEVFVPHIYNQDLDDNITAKKVIDNFVAFYRTNVKTPRIKELGEKLKTIDKYIIDQKKYSDLLINETIDTDLNSTYFFEALKENDHFSFLERNTSKNLYLKFKEKMNRDDIEKILIKKQMSTVNRRNLYGDPKADLLDNVLDKIIAEPAHDEHKFNASIRDSMYWDPQVELEQLNEYHKHDGRRLFKGERTTVKYYPFMVSVHVMGRFWCGGSLYAPDLVITSASCLQLMHNNRFFRENPRAIKVKVGSNHSRIGGEDINSLEVYFHPSYNPKFLRHNIAIIRLERHLSFNYHRVPKIIPISHEHHGMPDTVEVMVLGWGVKKMSQRLSYEPVFLQRKFLPVYPNKFCKEIYGDSFVTDTMFCAGTMTTGEGACDHDAGGPAILAGKLVGIISFGPSVCGYPNVPTVFTLVGAYDDWLETIRDNIPSYVTGRVRTTTTHRRTRLTEFTIPKSEYKYIHYFTPIGPSNRQTETAATPRVVVEEAVPFVMETTTTAVTVDEPTAEEGLREGAGENTSLDDLRLDKKMNRNKSEPVKMVDQFDDGWSIDFKKK